MLLFTLFALVGAFYLVHTLGWKITDRLTVQQSADRAAYSAAAVNARSLNMLEHLNSAMVASRAIESIYDGVEQMYPVIMAEACGICAASWGSGGYWCNLCRKMGSKEASVFNQISQGGAKLKVLTQSIGALGKATVKGTPKWASTVAEKIAKANGATRAWAHPRDQDRLPFSDTKHDELQSRTAKVARRAYVQHILPKDPVYLWGGTQMPQYLGAISGKAQSVDGPYWAPDYGEDRKAQRRALVQTVFTSVRADDEKRLGRMAAAGVKETKSAFGKPLEVAVARAEPYFTLNGGKPDGRPGWSARLRPVQIDNEARQSLGKVANKVGWLGKWKPAFQGNLAEARVPQ